MPPRTMVPLSYLNQFSAMPGVNYPAYIQDVQKSDEIYFSLDHILKTLPLKNTFFGVNKLQFDLYFVPERFYNPVLHDDSIDFDPFNVVYPYIQINQYPSTVDALDDGTLPRPGIHVSSLAHFLGLPENVLEGPGSTATQPTTRIVNAVPFLGYVDINKSYYVNTQEENFYFLGEGSATSGDPVPAIKSGLLSDLDEFRKAILRSNPTQNSNIGALALSLDNPLAPKHFRYPSGGLFLRTYLPDRFTVFVNTVGYNATLSSSLVDVSAGSFNLDQLRFAEALNGMLQRTLVAGRRYSDWQQVQFGGSLKGPIECPEFICSFNSDMYFEDVVQTSGQTDESNHLGSLGSRGVGSIMKRRHKYYVRENGFLIGIYSIIPRVSYFEGTRHWLRWQKISDRHVPAMDGIGFQDLSADDLYSRASTQNPANPWKPLSPSIGKQPAWVEYMTRVNELHGLFAKRDAYMPLVYARRFQASGQNPGTLAYTTYINPTGYNYPFADASLSAENYWCQFRFRVSARRAISKRVMPHLANR